MTNEIEVFVHSVEFVQPSFGSFGSHRFAEVTFRPTHQGVHSDLVGEFKISVSEEKGREYLDAMENGTVFNIGINAAVAA